MDFKEYNVCLEIRKAKPRWFGREENLESKLECLETFKAKGSPSNIHVLIPFLKNDNNKILQRRTAEVIISLFDRLKSQNQLYDSLKYIPINVLDVDFFNKTFPRDISARLLALSSLNRNGYVRQHAVEVLATMKHPSAIRFLIMRLNDWVKNVREVAASSIQRYFTDEYRKQFIRELDYIEALRNAGRVNLTTEYELILSYILEKKLNNEFYKALTVTDKARLLYLKKYIERNRVDSQLIAILLSDRSFLIRIQALEQLNGLDPSEQSRVILELLNDRSSQVRLKTLYYLRDNSIQYHDAILKLTSDLSASVRDLARYLLRTYELSFREIYKGRIHKNDQKVGSILGLAEVGTTKDIDLLKTFIETENNKAKLACLTGIQKLDLQRAKVFAVKLFQGESNKIRKRCVEILSRTWDEDVMVEIKRMYGSGDSVLKKMVLTLYNSVGGWNTLGFLVRGVSEEDMEVRELAWSFLQKWKENALGLFTGRQRK